MLILTSRGVITITYIIMQLLNAFYFGLRALVSFDKRGMVYLDIYIIIGGD